MRIYNNNEPNYSPAWRSLHARRLNRRSVLQICGRTGIGVVAISLVGGWQTIEENDSKVNNTESMKADLESEISPSTSKKNGPSQTKKTNDVKQINQIGSKNTRTPGGILRTASPLKSHDSFDPHRTNNLPTADWMSHFMNRLIRWRNQEKNELEGDLADLPEIPDEETYIFKIKDGAKFWNPNLFDQKAVRLVTAEDILFNVQRQIEEIEHNETTSSNFISSKKYRRTASLKILGPQTIAMTTRGPDGTYLASVHAGPFSWITSREAVENFEHRWEHEQYNQELITGSGFMIPASFDPEESLILRRNNQYWRTDINNQPLPFLRGRAFYNLTTPESVSEAYREQRIDLAGFPLSGSEIKTLSQEFPEHVVTERPIGFTVDAWFNFNPDWKGDNGEGNPWLDRRVAYAFHLSIYRHRMAKLIYQGNAKLSANALTPWFAGSWGPNEEELLNWPGFRMDRNSDIQEARQLLDAAGVEYNASFVLFTPEIWEQANPGSRNFLRAMYEQATHRTVNIQVKSSEVISERLANGTLPGKAPSWNNPPEQIDPTISFSESLLPGATHNFLNYDYAPVASLVRKMEATLDNEKRKKISRQITQILMGVDPVHGVSGFAPTVGVMNGIQPEIRWPYVHTDENTNQFGSAEHNHERSWIDINHKDYSE